MMQQTGGPNAHVKPIGIWTEHKTPEGKLYYFNMAVGKSFWKIPSYMHELGSTPIESEGTNKSEASESENVLNATSQQQPDKETAAAAAQSFLDQFLQPDSNISSNTFESKDDTQEPKGEDIIEESKLKSGQNTSISINSYASVQARISKAVQQRTSEVRKKQKTKHG